MIKLDKDEQDIEDHFESSTSVRNEKKLKKHLLLAAKEYLKNKKLKQTK